MEGEIILEPFGRNTAPAIALAALHAMKDNNDPLLLVLAADHVISNIPEFENAIATATELAFDNKLVTFSIVADKPETGYGYIKRGDSIFEHDAYKVQKFEEKPDEETAQKYLDSGDYYWNSGMFLFKASRYIDELKKFHPEMVEICQKSIQSESNDLDFIHLDCETFGCDRQPSLVTS